MSEDFDEQASLHAYGDNAVEEVDKRPTRVELAEALNEADVPMPLATADAILDPEE